MTPTIILPSVSEFLVLARNGCRFSDMEAAVGQNCVRQLIAQNVLQLDDAPRTTDCVECGQPHVEELKFDRSTLRWWWHCPDLGEQSIGTSDLDLVTVSARGLVWQICRLLGLEPPRIQEADGLFAHTALLGALEKPDRTLFIALELETAASVFETASEVAKGSKSGGWVISTRPSFDFALPRNHRWICVDELFGLTDAGFALKVAAPPWIGSEANRTKASPKEKAENMWRIFKARRKARAAKPSTLTDEADTIRRLMPDHLRLAKGTIENRIRKEFAEERASRPRHTHAKKRGPRRGRG